ncbi:WXG100 family type VII secretion target [Embleya sp. NBC_00896]|uniref:WXG100 family type VII secretion target n=1 Tax=Embleya sp. NBC_00896 TaxID=2975961 RepID=UPI003865667F|nr:WXG100 family type VII secretion target [Embleya sp. NBC_00896]
MTADAGTGYKALPSDFKTAGKAFTDAGRRVAAIRTALKGSIEGLGECWGDDDLGNGFAKEYKPNRDKVLEALEALAKGLGEIGKGLDTAATNYQKADDHARETFGGKA